MGLNALLSLGCRCLSFGVNGPLRSCTVFSVRVKRWRRTCRRECPTFCTCGSLNVHDGKGRNQWLKLTCCSRCREAWGRWWGGGAGWRRGRDPMGERRQWALTPVTPWRRGEPGDFPPTGEQLPSAEKKHNGDENQDGLDHLKQMQMKFNIPKRQKLLCVEMSSSCLHSSRFQGNLSNIHQGSLTTKSPFCFAAANMRPLFKKVQMFLFQWILKRL